MNVPNVNIASLANPIALDQNLANKTIKSEASQTFDSFFQSYMDVLNQTSASQLSYEQLQIDYATNKTDDMLSVILAQQKASASLNFTLQVTNRIISAYQEIMRMSL